MPTSKSRADIRVTFKKNLKSSSIKLVLTVKFYILISYIAKMLSFSSQVTAKTNLFKYR